MVQVHKGFGVAMLLWGYFDGRGLTPAAIVGVPLFLLLTIALWRAEPLFIEQSEKIENEIQ